MPEVPCHCGARYRWTDDRAGRHVRCSCGRVLRMPPAPPADDVDAGDFVIQPPPPKSDDDLRACPACAELLAPGSVLCMNCGFDVRTGAITRIEDDETDPPQDMASRFRRGGIEALNNREIPIAVIVIGTIVAAAASIRSPRGAVAFAGWYPAMAIMRISVMVTAISLVGWIGKEYFGSFSGRLLVCAAIFAVFAGFGAVLMAVDTRFGLLGIWLIRIPLYYLAIQWFFDMDGLIAFFTALVMFIFDFFAFVPLIAAGVLVP